MSETQETQEAREARETTTWWGCPRRGEPAEPVSIEVDHVDDVYVYEVARSDVGELLVLPRSRFKHEIVFCPTRKEALERQAARWEWSVSILRDDLTRTERQLSVAIDLASRG